MAMECSECRSGIESYLRKRVANGGSITLGRPFADHVAECHSCAIYLAVSMRIAEGATPADFATPRDLQKRVAQRVIGSIGSDTGQVFKPKRTIHRYLLVAAALVVMFMPFLHERDAGFLLDQGVGIEAARVQLVLEVPHAQSVVVVGDWNGWNVHADRLAKADDGDTWSIEMELERGKEYRYQFVIDGDQWIPDPHAYMQVDDGFGGMNSVLEM